VGERKKKEKNELIVLQKKIHGFIKAKTQQNPIGPNKQAKSPNWEKPKTKAQKLFLQYIVDWF
jgi:hypothetical protein